MRLNKLILIFVLVVSLFAKEEYININFKNLKIEDLVKITAKILNKNILFTTHVNGKVDFISNKPVKKSDILKLVIYVLESKGYTIIENNGILRVVRLNDASKYNVPVIKNKEKDTFQIITEIFTIENSNVDYVASKIRHLLSRSAKLVTDKTSNSIIVTDFIDNIKTIKKVIHLITTGNKKTVKIIKLKNLKGSNIIGDLKQVAKSVFNEKIEKERVTILLNKDINSIMFVGKRVNVNFMVKYLEDLDKQGSLIERVVEVIPLKNVEVKNVIGILGGIIANKKYKDLNLKPYIAQDKESNSIILMGPKDELKYLKELIKKLDIEKQQVYVQAKIIEISQRKLRDVGIKYGIMGGKVTSRGLLTFSSALNGGSSIAFDTTKLGLNVPNIDKGLALGATLNLLNENGAANIVSEPSLLCINNKESSLYVGKTISIKTGTTVSSGGVTKDTFKREDIGLTLKIKPRISTGNKVTLEIKTTVEDVDQATTNGQPNTSKKDLLTTAIVNNGESIILGGYIKNTKQKTISKIPLLGDIPLLGALFRSETEVKDQINLVIIITPYIVPKSKDLTYIREKLAELKILEEQYTKEVMLRLKKAKLSAKLNDLQTKEELIELNKQEKEVNEELNKYKKNKIDSKKETKKSDNEIPQYVKDMFGI